jgi:hypothetical protein
MQKNVDKNCFQSVFFCVFRVLRGPFTMSVFNLLFICNEIEIKSDAFIIFQIYFN